MTSPSISAPPTGPAKRGALTLNYPNVIFISALTIAGFLLVGCGGGSSATPTPTQVTQAAIESVDGRAVSANSEEIVLRTANGERTFKIAPEDEKAVGPEHVESHLGIATLGFKVYYMTENGVDYAVSVEEIKGSTLGFD